MKILAILILLTIGLHAQSTGLLVTSQASTYADSLQFNTDGVAGKDSVKIIKLNLIPNYIRIFVVGNANSSVDSLNVKFGVVRYKESKEALDTLWGSVAGLKDSVWNTVSTIVNNSVGKDYNIYSLPPFDLMKISLINYRAALPTRKVDIVVQTKKD